MHRKDPRTDENAFSPTVPLLALSSLPTCLPHTERKFTSIKTSWPIFPSVEPRQSQRLLCGVQARVQLWGCNATASRHNCGSERGRNERGRQSLADKKKWNRVGRKAIKEGGREGASDRECDREFSNLEFFGNLAQRSFFKNPRPFLTASCDRMPRLRDW